MTLESWIAAAVEDAERRGLPGLKPLLEALARSTKLLREADLGAKAGAASDEGRLKP